MLPKIDAIIEDLINNNDFNRRTYGKTVEVPNKLTCRQCNKIFKPNGSTYGRLMRQNSGDFCSSKHRQTYYKGKNES